MNLTPVDIIALRCEATCQRLRLHETDAAHTGVVMVKAEWLLELIEGYENWEARAERIACTDNVIFIGDGEDGDIDSVAIAVARKVAAHVAQETRERDERIKEHVQVILDIISDDESIKLQEGRDDCQTRLNEILDALANTAKGGE